MTSDAAEEDMCICVDCRWVDRCQAYHAVERQHGAPHLTAHPDLVPLEPRIHISVLDLPGGASGVEWDVRACTSFDAEPGRWSRLRPGEALPR
ncbi:MAG: Uncharacterised protein [Synechococcus sp. CC9902]|jgi:hypothetical protein|nr:MAG: Uncharacterised protein [Synechococcus sp. CC9902]